ncbi:MAG TPA: hypothetical protein VNA69_16360 [Thermoanaerobaculia bacterium]|nr:hypothetical protein [Thermoanaerobaculia bacterium]
MILVVASVVMFVGMLNSLHHSWAGERLLAASNPDSEYVTANIGRPPIAALKERSSSEYLEARDRHLARYHEFYSALMKTYVETGFGVRAPFFGVFVDVNDLGAIGGLAFLIMLVMLAFSLRREIENLKVAFYRAFEEHSLTELYDILAMHQFFTVARRQSGDNRAIAALFPKVVCLMPLVVQIVVVAHDWVTNATGETLDVAHNSILLLWELIWTVVMIPVTAWIVVQVSRIDTIWDDWADIRFGFTATHVTRGSRWRAFLRGATAIRRLHISEAALSPRTA